MNVRGQAGVVGRGDELAAITEFLDGIAGGCASLVLEGTAGIGKTTLWRSGVEAAEAAGVRVLVARPAANEAAFGLGALSDLLDGVPDGTIDELPAPQRRALRVARSLEETTEPVEPRLFGVALLGALRLLAAETPILIAVDDVQWLDAASADALSFAGRRLAGHRVGALVTRRSEEPGAAPSLPEPVETVAVGPLSIGALQRLIASRVEVTLGRRALRRVFDAAAGNPFYALELARSLGRPASASRDPMPVPPGLQELLRRRLDELPPETCEVLLVAALLLEPDLAVLERVAGIGAFDRLAPALRGRLVEVEQTTVRFAHPLFAAAVVEAADPLQLRRLHRSLAAIATAPSERARHLAASADPPDEEIASALAGAADHERLRGAPAAAADLAFDAWRFTADPDRRTERLLDACEHRLLAGEFADVGPLLEPALASLPSGPAKARGLYLLGRSHYGGPRKSELLSAALDEVGDDLRLRATILMEHRSYLIKGELVTEGAEPALAEAVELARRVGDPDLEERARGNYAWALAVLGRRIEPSEHARRHVLADDAERARAVQLLWRGESEAARSILEPLRERAREIGEGWSELIYTLHLFELEARRGDWPAVERVRADLEVLCTGVESAEPVLLRADSLLAAVRGDRERAERAAAEATGTSDRWQQLETARAVGVAAFADGDLPEAAQLLAGVFDQTVAAGFGDPGTIPVAPDLIEALAGLGRREDALAVLAWLEERSKEQSHPWGLALAARCRGIVDRDEEALRVSLARLDRLSLPFERARTLLELGAQVRRAGRRTDAREALAEARLEFERLGTPPWTARAESEIARLGGRAPAGSALTPAEQRVAAMLAEGKTKKEVAAALFVSVHTVDSTLRRVYAKLGIHSRVDLARRLS